MKRRPYQMRAVAKFVGLSVTPMRLPSGQGKTQAILDFIAKHPHKRVLFVQHAGGEPPTPPSIVCDEVHHVTTTVKKTKKRTGKDGR